MFTTVNLNNDNVLKHVQNFHLDYAYVYVLAFDKSEESRRHFLHNMFLRNPPA